MTDPKHVQACSSWARSGDLRVLVVAMLLTFRAGSSSSESCSETGIPALLYRLPVGPKDCL